MNKGLLQIDVSQYETKKDLIKINFQNDEAFQINFKEFYVQSEYLLNKYKYQEATTSIQSEIEETKDKFNISDESIKYFLQLIEFKKINIPIEHFKAFCILSEYFCISKFTAILDNIRRELLLKDLDFSIQILLDSESPNNFETKITSKIENFLIERINECIKNNKFKELPVSTICRIVEQCKEKVDQDLLVDFIFESSKTRFILLKYVVLHKLCDDKIEELIKLIEEQDENLRKMCEEYIVFDIMFIKNVKNKHNQLVNELNQSKVKFDQKEEELNQTKQELNQTKVKLNQKEEELNQTKQELNQTKAKFDQKEEELNQTKQELNQTKVKLNQKEEELNQCKKEIMEVKDSLIKKSEMRPYTQSILVGGCVNGDRLGEKPNSKNKSGREIISPPVKLSFDPSSLLSYSTYCWHSVMVMSDGSLKRAGQIWGDKTNNSLQEKDTGGFIDFCIKDNSGRQLAAVSAVSHINGTLYIFSKSNGSGKQLVLCSGYINNGKPVFLDIGNHQPVALFGGCDHSAAIGSEGEIIFINRYSPISEIAAVFLPDGEKASSIACCRDSVVVLSSNSRVFESPVKDRSSVLKFSPVSELSDQEIVCLSGTWEHFLAVSKEGRIFGRGSNQNGKLGLGKGTESVSSFTEIRSLVGYEIRAAYAGYNHSLFETREGKILSCGCNEYSQLFLSSGPGEDVYSPTETLITSGATFCIAGAHTSAVFIGNSPPPNTPNMRI